MKYYEVWVASQRYHGDTGLTYSSPDELPIGSVVLVPLQRQTVVAIVTKQTTEPSFKTRDILRVVHANPAPDELIKLMDWMRVYYPAPFGQILSLALPSTLGQQSRKPEVHTATNSSPVKLPPLTKDQRAALEQIDAHPSTSIMLHGDTGSGKTRIYVELASKKLQHQQSVILLTPEIGLTPQLATVMKETFGDLVVILHSEQSAVTRRNTWLRILGSTEPLVIIGPRSALFAPVKNVGLIIIDESHESAYKQEQAPHYLATRVAARLADLHQAQLILGSATPLVTDYYTFKQKELPIIRMKEQAKKSDLKKPSVVIIDLKKREHFSRSPWISDPLLAAIEASLEQKQQALVFLNRRGTARLILCQACGWEALCPRCDLPLTYHGDKHISMCHTCGYSENSPTACPDCSSNDIIFRSIGTKSLTTELERIFSGAAIERFDSDNSKAESIEQRYADIASGEVDILVGTQMLGKGLDLPKLSVLGIIQADTSLTFPDYTSEERTYQLVNQALGRINRGHVMGTAFIQTYHPESKLLNAASRSDFEEFYEQQLAERKLYHFPPFRFLLKLTCSRASSSTARKAAEQLATKLRSTHKGIEVIGPGPAFTEKVHNQYRWQLIIKANQRSLLTGIVQELPANWSYDIDPMNLL